MSSSSGLERLWLSSFGTIQLVAFHHDIPPRFNAGTGLGGIWNISLGSRPQIRRQDSTLGVMDSDPDQRGGTQTTLPQNLALARAAELVNRTHIQHTTISGNTSNVRPPYLSCRLRFPPQQAGPPTSNPIDLRRRSPFSQPTAPPVLPPGRRLFKIIRHPPQTFAPELKPRDPLLTTHRSLLAWAPILLPSARNPRAGKIASANCEKESRREKESGREIWNARRERERSDPSSLHPSHRLLLQISQPPNPWTRRFRCSPPVKPLQPVKKPPHLLSRSPSLKKIGGSKPPRPPSRSRARNQRRGRRGSAL